MFVAIAAASVMICAHSCNDCYSVHLLDEELETGSAATVLDISGGICR